MRVPVADVGHNQRVTDAAIHQHGGFAYSERSTINIDTSENNDKEHVGGSRGLRTMLWTMRKCPRW